MKLIVQITLQPTPEQAQALKATVEETNRARNYISNIAWAGRTFGKSALQKICYYEVRKLFGLSAQITFRALTSVGEVYQFDKRTKQSFQPLSPISYDERVLSFSLKDQMLSIWTLNGRERMPFVCDERQRDLLRRRQGESDLVFHRGQWYLRVMCELPAPEAHELDVALNVDVSPAKPASPSSEMLHQH